MKKLITIFNYPDFVYMCMWTNHTNVKNDTPIYLNPLCDGGE